VNRPGSADTESHAARLKRRLADVLDRYDEHARVRLHRAISWIARAEMEAKDDDARFVFLWIAFNAAYAGEFALEGSARKVLDSFFAKLLELDGDDRIAGLLLRTFPGPIRTLIENRHVFEPFWRALREHDASRRWEARFEASRKIALRSVLDGRTDRVLSVVFDRLYVLRNQLVHGGATWNSRVNRAQVRDGANILAALVPLMIEIMLDHPQADFGPVLYPVVT